MFVFKFMSVMSIFFLLSFMGLKKHKVAKNTCILVYARSLYLNCLCNANVQWLYQQRNQMAIPHCAPRRLILLTMSKDIPN
ncbi:hypothetical protein GGI42DRAFT_62863 [Trichoderma sp. SZMC 28013]